MSDPSMTAPERVFDPTADLPGGTTVLEASAGTGKTHTIAAVTARLIALGQAGIDRVMLVTFARSASLELRSRVYERLQSSARALEQAARGVGAPDGLDPVDAQLCSAPAGELVERRDRLRAALAGFDRAVIATTHEFCSRLLAELGVLVDHDTTMRFVEDTGELRSQVIDDAFLARACSGDTTIDHEQAVAIGQAVLGHPELPLLPAPEGAGDGQGRLALARDVRARMRRRMRAMGVYGYEDMVHRVVDALDDPCTGDRAARALAGRFDLVMVDEFQDTDPAQWRILERAFHHRTRLVVIGDPKQSIYGFRGADLQAYLTAREHADQRFTLSRNHRSDAAVVDGITELFGRAPLGQPGQSVTVTPVTSSWTGRRLVLDGDSAPAVQVRLLAPTEEFTAAGAREAIAADLVREFIALLARGRIDEGGRTRNLRAGDMAVLVRTRRVGDQVRRALTRAGVPAVFTGGEGIFASGGALAWQRLLEAMCDPRPPLLFRLALTELIGWSPEQLAGADDEDRNRLLILVTSLRETMVETGPAAVLERLCSGEGDGSAGLMARLLADARDGERLLTDLRHVTELLDRERRHSGRDLAGMRDWLAAAVREAAGRSDDDAVRRLETDRSAVTIMTIHRAKGLQFPVVALPDMANKYIGTRPRDRLGRTLVHEDGVLSLDLFGDLSDERHRAKIAEEQAEDLRLLYVAATRAQSRLLTWWARTRRNTASSALHRLLMNPPGSTELASSYRVGADIETAAAGRGLVQLVTVPRPAGAPDAPMPAPRPSRLVGRNFHDNIDRSWARTSYSALTAGLHGSGSPLPGADGNGTEDEPELGAVPSPAGAPVDDATALSELPGGTQFGSLVHSVLELVDPAGPRLAERTRATAARMLTRWPVAGVTAEQLQLGLETVMRTPLGELTGGASLREIGAVNRLTELAFDLPLGSATTSRELGAIAELWGDRTLVPADDPLVDYGPVLAGSEAAGTALRGFLTGSIDAVLRLPAGGQAPDRAAPVPSGEARYGLIDYKTNRIPTRPHERLGPHVYTPAAMTGAMIEAHYPLQALLYCVGLHRYLLWRLPGYDPARQFAGVGYLFVRGMAGPHGPAGAAMPPGVFTWHPSIGLIEAASAVLAGGQRAGGGR